MLAPPLAPDSLARPARVLPDAGGHGGVERAVAWLEGLDTERTWPVLIAEGDLADREADRLRGHGAEVRRFREGRGIGKRLRRRVELLRRARVDRIVLDEVAPPDPGWRLALALARMALRRRSGARAAAPSRRPGDPGRILFVLKSRPDEPRAHVLQALATIRGLLEEGATVRLLCPLDERVEAVVRERIGPVGERLELAAAPRFRRRIETFGTVAECMAEAAADGFGVVYVRQPRIAPFLLEAARPLGLPVFLEAHQPYATWALRERERLLRGADAAALPRYARADRRLEAALYASATGVVATTRALAKRVARLAPGTPRLLARNPPPGATWEGDPPPLRQRPIDVLYAGRLDPVKGTDVLVRALALVAGARAVLLGPGERERSSLEALVEGLGLGDRVEVRPWIEPQRAAALFRAARILVHPLPARGSREWRIFTCPLKILEGMAHGCVVVSSDLPAVRELIRPGREGLLVPPGDPRALAEAIREALAGGDDAQRMADLGRRRVSPLHPRRRARRLLAFFRAATGRDL